MNQEQLIKLLGEPDIKTKEELKYLIREKYGTNIDPEYISTFIILFDDNGEVRDCKIKRDS